MHCGAPAAPVAPAPFNSVQFSSSSVPVHFQFSSSSVPVPFRSVPFRSVPFRSVPFRSVPFRSVPFTSLIDLNSTTYKILIKQLTATNNYST